MRPSLVRGLSGHVMSARVHVQGYVSPAASSLPRHSRYSAPRRLAAVRGRAAPRRKRPLVPVEAEPEEVVLDHSGILRLRTLRVEILDAQYPPAAAAAGRKPRKQSREGVAQVHPPRRRRREPPDRRRPALNISVLAVQIRRNRYADAKLTKTATSPACAPPMLGHGKTV